MMKKKLMWCVGVVLVLACAGARTASAQSVDDWTAVQQLQAELKADRQAVVAGNLPLSDTESQAFWPVYKAYRAEIEALGDRTAKLIVDFAGNFDAITDVKAQEYFKELIAIDRDKLAVREKYAPQVKGVLPVEKAVRFFQIENKLDAVVNMGLASSIPLVSTKK